MNINKSLLFRKSNRGYFYALISAILFGSITTVAKPLLITNLSPLTLSSFTYLIAGVFTLILYFLKRENKIEKPARNDFRLLILIGIIGATIAPLAYFTGLQITSASNTSVLTNGEIIFTVLIAIVFFKEKLSLVGYLGIVSSIVGILLITVDFKNQSFFDFNIGDILVICSTLLWALDNNLSKIASRRIPSTLTIVMIKSLIGGSILFVISRALRETVQINLENILPLLVLGIGGFGLSLYFFLKAMRIIGTLKSIIIFSSSAIFGIIFSVILLKEAANWSTVFAIVLMGIGIYFVSKDEYKNNIE